MSESQSAYKQVVKATSIFGGVQVFNILISVVRSKVIALFLGPAGMGIAGLLNAVIGLVAMGTNFGLDTSAVKSISVAVNEENPIEISKNVTILKRLIWFTGILGMLLTILFSPLLSAITFGNSDYTFAFIWIAVTLLLRQLTSGHLAVLQGFRKLEYLAKANVYGSFFGLVFTIPLYYYWKIDAIVPAIIVATIFPLLFSWFYSDKLKIKHTKITNSQALSEGKEIIRLGFSLSFIGLLTTLSAYALQIFISNSGGLAEVGLFNAGFAIINSYVGLIFTAMSTDYFPRLAAVCSDNSKVREMVKQQAYTAILIMAPVVILFLIFAPWIVTTLYSGDFLAITAMISWGILGMIFKAVSWSMGYILIAKGDSRMFMRTSIFFNSLFLVINILGYHFYGLEGLGVTFFVNYVIHFSVLLLLTYKRYEFYFDREFYELFVSYAVLCGAAFLLTYIPNVFVKYILMAAIAIFSVAYSLFLLDKKTNIKTWVKNKTTKK